MIKNILILAVTITLSACNNIDNNKQEEDLSVTETVEILNKCPENLPTCIELNGHAEYQSSLWDYQKRLLFNHSQIKARLNKGKLKKYKINNVSKSPEGCNGNTNFALTGFAKNGNPIIVTNKGSLEIDSAFINYYDCANCALLINKQTKRVEYIKNVPRYDYNTIDRWTYDDAGNIILIKQEQCIMLHNDRLFELVDSSLCNENVRMTNLYEGNFDEWNWNYPGEPREYPEKPVNLADIYEEVYPKSDMHRPQNIEYFAKEVYNSSRYEVPSSDKYLIRLHKDRCMD